MDRGALIKTCPRCRHNRSVTEFGRSSRTADGRYTFCVYCVRDANLLRAYGIDGEHFDEMLAEQDGKCPICGGTLKEGKGSAVDHDHTSGKIRGILCTSCNLGLGHFRENPVYLESAIKYVCRSEERMSKDMRKKCLHCGEAELLAMVTITKAVPLADKGGTIKIGGQKIGQMDLKWSWDKIANKEDAPDQKIRGPIICGACETEHFFVVGDKNPLRKGSVVEAREMGYDELRTKA